MRTLPCLHTFHSACAEEWLQKKKVCPLCQFPIDTSDQHADADAFTEMDAAIAESDGGGSSDAAEFSRGMNETATRSS